MKTFHVAVIGAGASGLFFGSLFEGTKEYKDNNSLIILEANKKPGMKILMSGGGACNLTHSGTIKDFTDKYFDKGKKIRGCLYKHSNLEMMDFFNRNGLKLITREDGKVFPQSMRAEDVRSFLERKSKENGFEIKTNTKVVAFSEDNNLVRIETSDGEIIWAENLVIAAGGKSYPVTGSDGSIFKILEKSSNVRITPLKSSLGPIYVKEYPFDSISGVSLKGVKGEIRRNGKLIAREKGDLLFADRCFSGPMIMHLCRFAAKGDNLVLNYVDAEDEGQYRKDFNVQISQSKRNLENSIADYTCLPKSFANIIAKRAEEKPKEASRLLTGDCFVVEKTADFNRAMTTAGGINLGDVDLKTMRLKPFPNIFAIGEVLDVDGKTGGYNLQFAYSSAAVVAEEILKGVNGSNQLSKGPAKSKNEKIQAGLIGYPISGSLSPLIHSMGFEQCSINGSYELFPTKNEELSIQIDQLKKRKIDGFNVTIPHKEKVIDFLDEISEEAKEIGAVNTVVNENGKLKGYNTDCRGFIEPILKDGLKIKNGKAILLGAGGAAKAVATALACENVREIVIFNRNLNRAENLRDRLRERHRDIKVSCFLLENTEELRKQSVNADLMVNATPLGNYLNIDASPVNDREVFRNKPYVADLIYKPQVTKFMKMAMEEGCNVAGGMNMLIHQGNLSFALWTGKEFSEEKVKEKLYSELF